MSPTLLSHLTPNKLDIKLVITVYEQDQVAIKSAMKQNVRCRRIEMKLLGNILFQDVTALCKIYRGQKPGLTVN